MNKLKFEVSIDEATKKSMHRLYDLTGKECYDKFGLTRCEKEVYSYDFTVGSTKYVADFEVVIPMEEDDEVWTQCVIYRVTESEYIEVTFSELDDRVEGEYYFELEDKKDDGTLEFYEVTFIVK